MADVFSDCHLWLRGSGTLDPNGNGRLDNNELVNAMTGATMSSTVYDGGKTLAYTNETVVMPMRGYTATLPTLYLPQTAVITNETTGAGYARSNSFQIYNVFNDYTDEYSFIIRFRPDKGKPLNGNWSWLMNMGYGSTGLMLGLNSTNENRYVHLFSSKMSHAVCQAVNGAWTDLGISIKGTNFTWVASTSTGKNEDSSNISHLTTRSGSFKDYNGGLSTKPASTTLTIGTESVSTDPCAIVHSATSWTTSNNSGKAFRGSIQQIAFWKRALTADELREALAWPNPDVLKIGVQDGKNAEFMGTDTTTPATMDDVVWKNSGSLAAGEELTIQFPLREKNNSDLPQMLRWISTADSPAALLQVAVNGKTVRTVSVPAGGRRNVFIAGTFFQAGTNELVITRADTGTQALKLDAVVLGGSWRVGLYDQSYFEFAHEGSPGVNYWTLDGNWKSVKRAFLGSGGGDNSNQYWHISLPSDLAGRYCGRLTMAVRSNAESATQLLLSYDGQVFAKKLAPQHGDTFTRDLSPQELTAGEHILYMSNGLGTTGRYWSPDCLTFELLNWPSGTFLIMR